MKVERELTVEYEFSEKEFLKQMNMKKEFEIVFLKWIYEKDKAKVLLKLKKKMTGDTF